MSPEELYPFYSDHLIRALRSNEWKKHFAMTDVVFHDRNIFGSRFFPVPDSLTISAVVTAEMCSKPIKLKDGSKVCPKPATITLNSQHYYFARRELFDRGYTCAKCATNTLWPPSPSAKCLHTPCTLKQILQSPFPVFSQSNGVLVPSWEYGMKKAHAEVAVRLIKAAVVG